MFPLLCTSPMNCPERVISGQFVAGVSPPRLPSPTEWQPAHERRHDDPAYGRTYSVMMPMTAAGVCDIPTRAAAVTAGEPRPSAMPAL